MNRSILKNLGKYIIFWKDLYRKNFVYQDVKLNDSFKANYKKFLTENGNEIEYLDYSSIIQTSKHKIIIVPNLWFVVAYFGKWVCKELLTYKNISVQIVDKIGDPNLSIDRFKSGTGVTLNQRNLFQKEAKEFLRSLNIEDGKKLDALTQRLYKFVTDYSWWLGSKTIDRGDFYLSPILNMLDLLVNSQSYVAEIAFNYANVPELNAVSTNILSIVEEYPIDGVFSAFLNDSLEQVGENDSQSKDKNEINLVITTNGTTDFRFRN